MHFQGGWVNVPAGAITRQETLHIRTAPTLPSAPSAKLMHPLATGVSVDLSGLQPLRPLTIALSVPRTLPSGARPQNMFVATVPSSGPAAPVLLATHYDSADQMLVAQADHLSSFYPVWLDGQALVGQFTREMAEVLQIRAPQPACAGQKVSLADGSTVQLAPGAWSSGTDPLLWGCLTSSDSHPGQVVVTLTDNRPMGYSVQIAPGASVSRDPPTLDSSTARLLFDIATLGKERNLELLTPASTVHITVPGTGLPSGTPVTVGAVRVDPGVAAASAAQTAFLLAAGLLIPVTGTSSKALSAALGSSGNLECLGGELANAASPGPDLIVSAAQLGLQCLGTVLKGAKATLALAVLGVVTSFFSTFTGMVNLLISYFTGANTFTVVLQRTPAPTQQPPTQQPPTQQPPTQQPPTQQPPTQQPPTQQPPTQQPPAWAGGLGPGVTVEPPSAAVGLNAVYGYLNNLLPQDAPASCQYVVPSSQSACQSVLNSTAQNGTFVSFTYTSIDIGYAVVDGNEALVVLDYSGVCLEVGIQENCPPDNNDPAALLDGGQSFSALWAAATTGSNNEFELIPLLQENGTWYVDYGKFPYPRYS